MRRRELLVGAALLAGSTRVSAQAPARHPRLAIVSISGARAVMNEDRGNYVSVFLKELRRLGHVEGRNLAIDRYGTEDYTSDAPTLAAQVVRSNPDVIYVISPGARFFHRETKTIPIVTITNDPIGLGLVQTLARPGGNVTGVTAEADFSVHGKRIALLREMFPALATLGCIAPRVIWDVSAGGPVRSAAASLGVPVTAVPIDLPGNAQLYPDAIAQAVHAGANAIMMIDSPDALSNRVVIASALAKVRIPAIHAFVEAVRAGGLMAYSFDLNELIRRMAGNVDAILRGANPGEIPFYQVSKFDLSINLGAARALGLDVPATLLSVAETVVE